MALLFYCLVIFINILMGIKYSKKDKKVNRMFFFISFIIIFLLMGGYRNTTGLSKDLLYSEIEYNNIINGIDSNYEIGYVLLIKIGGLFTNDFYIFRNGIIFIFLLILFFSIKKWVSNPHYVIALFSSYLIILNAEQLRYFLAFVIFSIGISFLIYSNNKRKKIIYVCFLLIASSIHFSFLIYLVFLLVSINSKSKKEIIIAIYVLLFCVIVFLNDNQIPGLSILLQSIDNYKINVYLNQTTNLGFLFPFLLHISSIVLTYWALKLSIISKDVENIQSIRYIYNLNLITILFFPLFMLQLTFYRLARNILIINYYVYAQIRTSQKISLDNRRIFSIIMWLSVFLWIFIDLVITTPSQSLLIPFFTENEYFVF